MKKIIYCIKWSRQDKKGRKVEYLQQKSLLGGWMEGQKGVLWIAYRNQKEIF